MEAGVKGVASGEGRVGVDGDVIEEGVDKDAVELEVGVGGVRALDGVGGVEGVEGAGVVEADELLEKSEFVVDGEAAEVVGGWSEEVDGELGGEGRDVVDRLIKFFRSVDPAIEKWKSRGERDYGEKLRKRKLCGCHVTPGKKENEVKSGKGN